MKHLILAVGFVAILGGCESLYEDDGIPRIRTQSDVEAYNATVSAESDKLVCAREFVIGSNIRQFVCMTVAQRERLREQGVDNIQTLNGISDRARGSAAN